jgi:hypothetical protein
MPLTAIPALNAGDLVWCDFSRKRERAQAHSFRRSARVALTFGRNSERVELYVNEERVYGPADDDLRHALFRDLSLSTVARQNHATRRSQDSKGD